MARDATCVSHNGSPVNVGYVSGFASSSCGPPRWQADSTSIVFTDARYGRGGSKAVEGARRPSSSSETCSQSSELRSRRLHTLAPWHSNPPDLRVAAHDTARREELAAELVPAANVLERIRARKDAVELAAVKPCGRGCSLASRWSACQRWSPVGEDRTRARLDARAAHAGGPRCRVAVVPGDRGKRSQRGAATSSCRATVTIWPRTRSC